MEEARELVRRLMLSVNRIDRVYDTIAKENDSVDNTQILLYALDDGVPHSQKSICEEWFIPKTTLNGVTKKLQAEGLLTLEKIPGKRRESFIVLTEQGKKYARQLLSPCYAFEDAVMRETVARYGRSFVDGLEFFALRMRDAFEEGRAAAQAAPSAGIDVLFEQNHIKNI